MEKQNCRKRRDSLGEWLVAGKPERLSGWQVAHEWAGNGLERPGQDEVE